MNETRPTTAFSNIEVVTETKTERTVDPSSTKVFRPSCIKPMRKGFWLRAARKLTLQSVLFIDTAKDTMNVGLPKMEQITCTA